MSAAAPLAIADAPTSHLDLLRAGVRFSREPAPALTADGHKYTADVLKVKGPNDPALMSALKAAVEWRVGLLACGLTEARARVWAAWQAQGKPVAVRSGVTHSGPDKGKPWRAESIPEGWCESCGMPAGVLLARPDGSTVLRADLGSSMCDLCTLAWARILSSRP